MENNTHKNKIKETSRGEEKENKKKKKKSKGEIVRWCSYRDNLANINCL